MTPRLGSVVSAQREALKLIRSCLWTFYQGSWFIITNLEKWLVEPMPVGLSEFDQRRFIAAQNDTPISSIIERAVMISTNEEFKRDYLGGNFDSWRRYTDNLHVIRSNDGTSRGRPTDCCCGDYMEGRICKHIVGM